MNPFLLPRRATVRLTLKIMAAVSRWLMLLLSGSVEVYLRTNFCRRYFLTLSLGFLFAAFCFGLAPDKSVLTHLFLLGKIGLIIWHSLSAFENNASPPHSRSSGESRAFWHRFGFPRFIVRCFGEPILCAITGLLV